MRVTDSRYWAQGARWQSSHYHGRWSPPGSPHDKARRGSVAEGVSTDSWMPCHTRYNSYVKLSKVRSLLDVLCRSGPKSRRNQFMRGSPPHRQEYRHLGDSYRPAGGHATSSPHSFSRAVTDTYRPCHSEDGRRQSCSSDSLGPPTHRTRHPDHESQYPCSSMSSTPPLQYGPSPTPPPRQDVPLPVGNANQKSDLQMSPLRESAQSSHCYPAHGSHTNPFNSYRRQIPGSPIRQPEVTHFVYQQGLRFRENQSSTESPLLPSPTSGAPPSKKRSSSPSPVPLEAATTMKGITSSHTTSQHVYEVPGAGTPGQNISQEASSPQGVVIGSTQSTNHRPAHVTDISSARVGDPHLRLPPSAVPLLAADDMPVQGM